MAANAVSYEVATRERLEDMLSMGMTSHQMAERLGIAERSVSRALRRHDLVPPRAPHFQLTFEQEARVEILLKEGMPLTWIAEDLQVPMNVLRHRVTVPPVNAQGWQSSWGSILHNPELLKLHREFAPRDVPESWVRMGVAS